jgi:uncharacterized protein YdgA (DUF945 family)
VALVGVVAAALLVPWVVGGRVRPLYQDALSEMVGRGWQLVDGRYERGWFTSVAQAELVAEAQQAPGTQKDAVRLQVASRILHGPWSLSSPRARPVAAVMETRVESRLPGLELPTLFLTTVIGVSGDGVMHVRLPAVDRPAGVQAAAVRTLEGKGQLQFDAGFSAFEGRLEVPSIGVELDADTRLAIEGAQIESEGSRSPGGLFSGTTVLSFDVLEARSRRGELRAEGLDASVRSVAKAKLIELRADSRIDRILLNGSEYERAILAVSLNGIPEDALAALRQAMRQSPRGPQAVGLARSLTPLLLAQAPRLALDRIEVTTPDGKAQGHFWLGVQRPPEGPTGRPAAWIERLEGAGEASLPDTLLLELLEARHQGLVLRDLRRRDPELTRIPPEVQPEIAAAARDQLAALMREGWVSRQHGRIVTAVRLGNALLTVNGKTFPLAGVGAR